MKVRLLLIFAGWLLGSAVLAQAPSAPFADASAARPERRVAGRRAAQLAPYRALRLDAPGLQALLATAPRTGTSTTAAAIAAAPVLVLPLPDGRNGRFRVVEAPLMSAGLAARLPRLRTYAGIGLDDASATVRFDFSTDRGFHGQILASGGTVLIEPATAVPALGPVAYRSFYQRDDLSAAGDPGSCEVVAAPGALPHRAAPGIPPSAATAAGSEVRTFRLCIAATGEYTVAVGGAGTSAQRVANAQAAIVTSVNFVMGIYERELAVDFVLVDNTAVVFTDPATDPYTNADKNALLGENQATLDNVIGAGGYDVGHVFTTAGGGLAVIGSACNGSTKGKGNSGTLSPTGAGFNLIVAHEMGHQFGAAHTFDANNTTNCGPANRNAATAWEPGSGTTIMAYPGTCGTQNVQVFRDAQFHTGSFDQMMYYITTAATCVVPTPVNHPIPAVSIGPMNQYTIPAGVPFRLTASVSGVPVGDPLTYSWEQMDLGPGDSLTAAQQPFDTRPLFRSYPDTTSPTRYFPRLRNLASGTSRLGERLPTVARSLTFRCTARTHELGPLGAYGSVNFSSFLTLNVVNMGAPFAVAAPVAGATWPAGSTQTVTWNLGGTAGTLVNCQLVNIRLSADGGVTFPYLVASNRPNSGSAIITVPGLSSTRVRVMVEAADNVFFNISPGDIAVSGPTVSSFTPDTGPVGTTVVITGKGFLTTLNVTLGNLLMTSFVIDSDSQITAVLPTTDAVYSAPISVTNSSGTATSNGSFRIKVVVAGVSPTAHQPNAAASAAPAITYVQSVKATSLGGMRVFGNQRQGRRAGGVSTSGNAAIFTPAQSFRPGEVVSVTATAQVTNQNGDFADPYVWQFRAATGGTGTGLFGAPQAINSPSSPRDTRLADVNNDGNLDLLVSLLWPVQVDVRLGDGQGHFAAAGSSAALTSQGIAIEVADVDSDQDLDLVAISTQYPYRLMIRLNNGNGNFAFVQDVAIPFGALRLAVGDVDADGDLDVAVHSGYQAGNLISLYHNAGNGTFALQSTFSVNVAPSDLAFGDLDNDGDLDLVTADFLGIYDEGTSRYTSSVSVRLNNGSGTFSGTSSVAVSDGPNRLLVGDVDRDGDLDVLVNSTAGNISTRLLSVLRNNGSGQLTAVAQPGTAGDSKISLADIDHDGNLDVVGLTSTGFLRVMRNNGTGTFVLDPASRRVSTGNSAEGLAFGDLDNDGDLDAVTTEPNADQVYVSLNQLQPAITGFAPASGAAGTVVTITGRGFTGAPAVVFNATLATSFTIDSDTQITATVPVGATTGPVIVSLAPNGAALIISTQTFTVTPSLPTISGFSPTTGPVGTVVTLSGTNLGGVTAVQIGNGPAQAFGLGSATQLTATVGAGSTTGPITVYAPNGQGSSAASFTLTVPPALPNLVVSGPQVISGSYNFVTITPTGVATLGGPLQVAGGLQISPGGGLLTNCQPLTGAGTFSLVAGATLGICDAAGISASGPTGAVQVTGARSFSPGAAYVYNGTANQLTGSGVPATVAELTCANPTTLYLTQAVAVRRVLRLTAGTLNANAQTLTLLSDAAGTAYAVHAGGSSSGPVTVQRYVGGPAGLGYRHLSSPVLATSASDLATAGYTPFVNAAYNPLPTPTLPAGQSPNIYGYDESRGGTTAAYAGFSTGYYSPTSLASLLTPGRGWDVLMAGGKTPDFVGALTTGNVPVTLSVTGPNSNPNAQKAGWALLGNPYAQPIDWDMATVPPGMSSSISVYRTTGGNNGQYLTRANGIGSLPDGIVPLGQGFFARATAPTTFTFTNALRVEANPAPVARPGIDARAQLRLTLTRVGQAEWDEAFVYFDAGATAALDLAYDAPRPGHNAGSVPTLSTLASTGEEVAVNGLPEALLTSGREVRVELAATLPLPGAYTLTVGVLANFGLTAVELLDQLTNTRYDLAQQPTLPLTAARDNEAVAGRFVLVIGGQRLTGVTASTTAPAPLVAYPNPAPGDGSVRISGCRPGGAVAVFDLTGRRVATGFADTLGGAGLSTRNLAAGVYAVRDDNGGSTRLVVE